MQQSLHKIKPNKIPHFATILHALRYWSLEKPNDRFAIFSAESGGLETTLTYKELDENSQKIASHLKSKGLVKGDRVMICLPLGPDFLSAFLGILKAGAIAIPTSYKNLVSQKMRRQCVAKFCLVDAPSHTNSASLTQKILVQDILNGKEVGPKKMEFIHVISPHENALIQYHFKKNPALKGLIFNHTQIISALCSLKDRLEITDSDCMVSFLPLYGNAGLLGGFLLSLYTGMRCVFLNPHQFIKNPLQWLSEISKHKATISMAPQAAYGLCSRKSGNFSFDLSSWKKVVCFGGVISVSTMKKFFDCFEKNGLLSTSLISAYGLSENGLAATLGLHYSDAWRKFKKISSGTALTDQDVRIMGFSGKFLGDRKTGQIVVRSHCASNSYFSIPPYPKDLYTDHWLKTGDDGYVNNRELYVVKSKRAHPFPLETFHLRRMMSYLMTGPVLSAMSALCILKMLYYKLILKKKLS